MSQLTIAESVNELKQLNESLSKLLEDPEYGLATWLIAVSQTVEKMAKTVGVKIE